MHVNSLYLVGCGGVLYHSTSSLSAIITADRLAAIDPDVSDGPGSLRQWAGCAPQIPKALLAYSKFFSEAPSKPTLDGPYFRPVETVLPELRRERSEFWVVLTDTGPSRTIVLKDLEKNRGRYNWGYITAGNGPNSAWAALFQNNAAGHSTPDMILAQAAVRKALYAKLDDVLSPDAENEHAEQHRCGNSQTIASNVMCAHLICRLLVDNFGGEEAFKGSALAFWDGPSGKVWTDRKTYPNPYVPSTPF